jgi:hypothetical protein
MKWQYLLSAILISVSAFCQNQPSRNPEQTDTTEVKRKLDLSKKAQWVDSYISLNYADQALLAAQQLNYKKGVAIAHNLKGFCYWSFGDNDLAIQSAMSALEIAQKENLPLIEA